METLDPQAVNLAKAIRQTESGGNFSATGKSGEYGAYQFTEPTWNATAKKYGVDVPLQQATPEQQNEVAYKQIKEWKDAGNNVGQIASMWNAGEKHKDAYLDESYKGVNHLGASYNVPAYAKSVATAYQTLKQGGQVGIDPNNPSSVGARKTFSETLPSPQTVEQQKESLRQKGEPVSTEEERAKPTFAGGIIRGLLHMPAQVGTSLLQAGETAIGHPLTEPFSGDYLGRVQPLGADPNATVEQGVSTATTGQLIKGGVKAGLEAAGYLVAPELKGIGGLLKGSSALEHPEVVKILGRSLGLGESVSPEIIKKAVSSMPREQTINVLKNALKETPISDIGQTADKAIVKALKQLELSTVEKQSLVKRLIKEGYSVEKGAILAKLLGVTLGGIVHKHTE